MNEQYNYVTNEKGIGSVIDSMRQIEEFITLLTRRFFGMSFYASIHFLFSRLNRVIILICRIYAAISISIFMTQKALK